MGLSNSRHSKSSTSAGLSALQKSEGSTLQQQQQMYLDQRSCDSKSISSVTFVPPERRSEGTPVVKAIKSSSSGIFERVNMNFGSNRTMRVARNSRRFSRHMTLKATMSATLGNRNGKLDDLVKCPRGENPDEWIAVNTFLFYEVAVKLFESCKTLCTEKSCEQMTAGPKYNYLWMDGKQYKKPTPKSARQYIELMFDWVFAFLSDADIFPQDDSLKLPKSFIKIARRIYKRLFRMYAHLFHQHLEAIKAHGTEAHLMSAFRHFVCFGVEMKLLEKVDLQPINTLAQSVLKNEGFDAPKK